MDFLDKLLKAKELIEGYAEQGADALEYGADVLHQIEQGMRDAAAFLKRPLVGAGADDDVVAKLEACKPTLSPTPVGAAPGAIPPWLVPVLADLLVKSIDAIIERLRKRREQNG